MTARSSRERWLFFGILAAGFLAVGGGTVVLYNASRGLRNNNPGNIRRSSTTWQGQAAEQTDPSFVRFEAPEWGIRAIARVLKTYSTTHGLTTVRAIISRWAPPSENPTAAYIANVARHVGVSEDAKLSPLGPYLPKLVEAIIRQENGIQPYPAELITRAIALA